MKLAILILVVMVIVAGLVGVPPEAEVLFIALAAFAYHRTKPKKSGPALHEEK